MIEIVDVRDLTDKERRKYELQQEIEQKQQELNELDTLSESDDTNTKDTELSGREKLQEKIGSLTPEEEEIVSKAIKKDNQKDSLSDEELQEIKERTQREYENITSDVMFSPKRAIIFVFVMILLVLASTILSQRSKQSTENIQTTIQDDEEITVNVDLD